MRSFNDEYIVILKELAKSNVQMMARYPMHFTSSQAPFIKELMDAGKVVGKLEYDNPHDLRITRIRINLSGRMLLDELETEQHTTPVNSASTARVSARHQSTLACPRVQRSPDCPLAAARDDQRPRHGHGPS